MSRTTPSHRFLRSIALLAMLLPFLALSVIARGVMPDRAADGTMALVLCSDAGPVDVVIDLATGEVSQKPQSPKDARCDWAMAQADVALERPLPLPLRLADAGAVTPITAQILWRPGFDPRAIHARGPPTPL